MLVEYKYVLGGFLRCNHFNASNNMLNVPKNAFQYASSNV